MSSHRFGDPRRDLVLFLDFDGVVRSGEFANRVGEAGLWTLDPEAVALVARIVGRTGARIVVSSTWRMGRSLSDLRGCLVAAGYPPPCPIIDKTPTDIPHPEPASENQRGFEIQAWLDANPRVRRFCILDDDADMAHLLPHLVRTTFERGIRPEHVELAVAMLAGG